MRQRRIFLWTIVFFLYLALAGIAYLGTFTRFLADDYCDAGSVIRLGLGGMLSQWYYNWTGRFSFIIVAGLFGLVGPKLAGLLPVFTILLWLFGSWWTLLPIIKRLNLSHPRLLGLITAGLLLLVLFSSIPNLYQSFYWQVGMVIWSLPLIVFTYSLGIILRYWLEGTDLLFSCITLFILTFIGGGFDEPFSAMQVTLFTISCLVTLGMGVRATRRRFLPVLGIALLGSLVAMVLVIIAPGNQVRLQMVGSQGVHPGLLRIITFSIRNMAFIFGKFFIKTPLWAAVSIIPPFIAGWLSSITVPSIAYGESSKSIWKRKWVVSIFIGAGIAIVLVISACAPVVYALNAYPDDRVIIVPQFIIVTAAIGLSAVLGMGLRKLGFLPDPVNHKYLAHILKAGILAVILIATIFSTSLTAVKIPDFQAFARNWDETSVLILQAVSTGQTEITVRKGSIGFGVADLSSNPNFYVNNCVATYYNVNKIFGR
jgi:hypothetical protein